MFPILLFTIVAVQARTAAVKYCEISGDDPVTQCYMKETLVSLTHSPNQFAVDRNSNTLYFSFDSGQGEYTAATYKIETKQITILKGIKDAYAISTAPNSKEIYFGGSYGIYKYNPYKKTLKRLNIKHLDIWWIFVKNYVYFIKFPSLISYYYSNGEIRVMSDFKDKAVHQIVMDMDNHTFFNNNSGLYGIKYGESNAVLLKKTPRFLNMATDMNGYVHACSEDGIYIVGKIIHKVKKILNIQGVLGITFDRSNNMIYSNSHELVRLTPVTGVE